MSKNLKSKELPIKSSSSEDKSRKKRSRVLYACKPELQELMDFVNLIPPGHEMKNVAEILGDRSALLSLHREGSPKWLENETHIGIAFDDYITSFPEDFQDLIHSAAIRETLRLIDDIRALPAGVSEQEAPNYWQRRVAISRKERQAYEHIRNMRKDLYRLAEIGEEKEKYLGKELDVVLGLFFVEHARLDQEGRIRRQPNRFAEIIEGVEASRIRACLICNKLFWANRKDKRCCSEEHSSIIRQRQSRKNKKEKGEIYSKFAKLRKQRTTRHKEKEIKDAPL